jgi:predicted acetyltransferase
MAPPLRIGTVADLDGLWDLFRIGFGQAASQRSAWVDRLDPGRSLLVDGPSGEVAAASHIRPLEQWFGGRPVALAGYSPVAVAPEHRGRGLGTAVTVGQYPDLRARGEVIAGLFPASLALYRRCGFEVAGSYVGRRFPARDLAGIRPSAPVAVRRGTTDDVDAVHRLHEATCPSRDGAVSRDERWWHDVMPRSLDGCFLYVVDDVDRPGEVLGYATFGHGPGRAPYDYSVVVAEVRSDDPEVLRALWRVVASSSSQAPDLDVIGPAEDDLFLLAPHAAPDVVTSEIRWMLRLVDVPGAMAARGWPASVRGRVEVAITDPHAPWNEGRWILELEGGRATAVRGGAGTVEATIGGLSSWWAGYATPSRLARTGHLAGPTDALVAMGELLPAVPPVLPDFY